MLIIRLKPIGKKKQISFRIVVGERRSKLNGRFIEDLGFYNPHNDKFSLKEERIKHWISNGAQVSDTVHNVLVKSGLIDAPKRKVKMRKSKKQVAETVAEVKTVPTSANSLVGGEVEAPVQEDVKKELQTESVSTESEVKEKVAPAV